MLETARIAATNICMHAEINRLPTPSDERLQFSVRLVDDPTVNPHDLVPYITSRCTNRRPYSSRPLSDEEKAALESSIGSEFRLRWFEGRERNKVASLLFTSAKIRLTIPEAYAVHREVIEWHSTSSETRIPDRAVGLDPVGLVLMRWAMQSWPRTRALGKYFGGTLIPRLQLELLPGRGCAAHFILCSNAPPGSVDDYVHIGAAVQRLWLTATKLGLQHQPELTPLIFSSYSRSNRRFTNDEDALKLSRAVADRLADLLRDANLDTAVWMARVGFGSPPAARSVRMATRALLVPPTG